MRKRKYNYILETGYVNDFLQERLKRTVAADQDEEVYSESVGSIDFEEKPVRVKCLGETKACDNHNVVDTKPCDNEDEYACKVCNASFAMKHQLENHEKRHVDRFDGSRAPVLKRTCPICYVITGSFRDLKVHFKKYHLNVKKLSCSECGKIFPPCLEELFRHKKEDHTTTNAPRRAREALESRSCRKCGLVLSTPTALIRHMRSLHNVMLRRHCNLCPRTFLTQKSLRQHKRVVHENVQSIAERLCAVCGGIFAKYDALQVHMKAMHGCAALYSCKKCRKGFPTKTRLDVHVCRAALPMAKVNHDVVNDVVGCRSTRSGKRYDVAADVKDDVMQKESRNVGTSKIRPPNTNLDVSCTYGLFGEEEHGSCDATIFEQQFVKLSLTV